MIASRGAGPDLRGRAHVLIKYHIISNIDNITQNNSFYNDFELWYKMIMHKNPPLNSRTLGKIDIAQGERAEDRRTLWISENGRKEIGTMHFSNHMDEIQLSKIRQIGELAGRMEKRDGPSSSSR